MVKVIDSTTAGSLPIGAKKIYIQNLSKKDSVVLTFLNSASDHQILQLQQNAILNFEYNQNSYPAMTFACNNDARIQIVAVY
jgi:hypothetical protein